MIYNRDDGQRDAANLGEHVPVSTAPSIPLIVWWNFMDARADARLVSRRDDKITRRFRRKKKEKHSTIGNSFSRRA